MVRKIIEESMFMLTKGSRYIIRSLESKDKPLITMGTFKGYTTIGSGDDALVIELDEMHEKMAGKTRIIPCSMIIAIDVLTSVKPKKEKYEEEVSRYFG